MTSTQLAQRLARHLTTSDLSLMPSTAMLDLVAAINEGLQAAYQLLPRRFKTTTVSETLRSPVTVSAAISERYSNVFTGAPFTAAQVGCTCQIGDDPQYNQIVSRTAVLDQYVGTNLSPQVQIWHDCVQLADSIECITSDVRIYDGVREVTLNRCVFDSRRRWWHTRHPASRPYHYQIEPAGVASGAPFSFMLRFYPMPAVDYRIRCEADISAPKVTFANILLTPIVLPFPERLTETALVPLCARALMTSLFWRDPQQRSVVMGAAAAAEGAIHKIDGDTGPGNHWMGTPTGF